MIDFRRGREAEAVGGPSLPVTGAVTVIGTLVACAALVGIMRVTGLWEYLPGDFAGSQGTPTALVPRPRIHQVRYHGIYSPNASLRTEVLPEPDPATEEFLSPVCGKGEPGEQASPTRIRRAQLLKHIWDDDLTCPSCRVQVELISIILEGDVLKKILEAVALTGGPASGLAAPPAPGRTVLSVQVGSLDSSERLEILRGDRVWLQPWNHGPSFHGEPRSNGWATAAIPDPMAPRPGQRLRLRLMPLDLAMVGRDMVRAIRVGWSEG